jgi:hypothetical protein
MSKSEDSVMATRVAKRIMAMAYKREDFKNKVESHLTGAIVHFYQVALAKKNGQTRWVQHWTTEFKQLVNNSLVAEIFHSIKGFKDRRKAFYEAVAEIKAGDTRYRGYAETVIKRDYNLTKLKVPLDDKDTAAFWNKVESAALPALDTMERR